MDAIKRLEARQADTQRANAAQKRRVWHLLQTTGLSDLTRTLVTHFGKPTGVVVETQTETVEWRR